MFAKLFFFFLYLSNIIYNNLNRLCSSFYQLGLFLTDYMRYAEAKKTYSRALQIFRKLKIKPNLYNDIMIEIRATHHTPSNRERAQKLTKRAKTPSSRTKGNQSPSFSFSFSFNELPREYNHPPSIIIK